MDPLELARNILLSAEALVAMLEPNAEPLRPVIPWPDYVKNGGWLIGQQHMRTKPLEYIVIHHEGSPESNPAGSSALAIHRYHRSLGWAAIGYHYIIERDGTINGGRSMETNGAHAAGYNGVSLGVCVIGNTEVIPPTTAQVEALKLLLPWLLHETGLAKEQIVGHGALNATTCPGKYLTIEIEKIKATL